MWSGWCVRSPDRLLNRGLAARVVRRFDSVGIYIRLSHLSDRPIQDAKVFEDRDRRVAMAPRLGCPDVSWLGTYWTFGSHGCVDILNAPDNGAATKGMALPWRLDETEQAA